MVIGSEDEVVMAPRAERDASPAAPAITLLPSSPDDDLLVELTSHGSDLSEAASALLLALDAGGGVGPLDAVDDGRGHRVRPPVHPLERSAPPQPDDGVSRSSGSVGERARGGADVPEHHCRALAIRPRIAVAGCAPER